MSVQGHFDYVMNELVWTCFVDNTNEVIREAMSFGILNLKIIIQIVVIGNIFF